ncbi:MAG: hypothetical protein OCD01_03320 [Fibrobacterales bacterium]
MKQQLLLSAFIGLGLIGCTQEAAVENALTPDANTEAVITGTVAYGYAAPDVDVEIIDQDGEEIFTGTTDEEGIFRAPIRHKHPKLPLLLRAHINDTTEFTSIISDDDGELGEGEEIHTHCNAVTDRATRELLGEDVDHKKLLGLKKQQILAKGEEVVDEVLGEDIDFESFYNKKEFKAAIKGREDVVPGVHDMMLHSIDDMAKKDGKPVKELVKEFKEDRKELFEKSEEFKSELADNLAEFKVETEALRTEIKDFANNHPEIVEHIKERHELMRGGAERPELDSAEIEARKALIEALAENCQEMTHEERVAYMDSVSAEFRDLMKEELQMLKEALTDPMTREDHHVIDSTMRKYARELIETLQPCPEFIKNVRERIEERHDGDQPAMERPEGEKPEGDRPAMERPEGEKPEGDRPAMERPEGEKPEGDRPEMEHSEGDRPSQEEMEALFKICKPELDNAEWVKPEECPEHHLKPELLPALELEETE